MRGNVLDKVETVSQRVATFEISTQQTLLNKLINLSHFPQFVINRSKVICQIV